MNHSLEAARCRKKPQVIAGLSLILLLIGRLMTHRVAPKAVEPAHPVPEIPIATAASGSTRAPISETGPGTASPLTRWEQLNRGDLSQYVARLRALGCPERALRDLVVGEVHSQFEKRRQDWVMEHRRRPDSPPAAREELVRSLESSRAEEETLLTTLLGHSWKDGLFYELRFATADMSSLERVRPEVGARVKAAESSFQDRRAAILAKSATGPYPQRATELREARLARDSELRAVLDEGEYLDHQLDQSGLGKEWRLQANRLGLSHSESADLLSLEMEAADALLTGSQASDTASSEDPWQEIEDRKRAILGPDRYDEYQRLQDPAYAGIQDLATQHRLPPETAAAAAEAHRAFVGLITRTAGDPDRSQNVTLGGLSAVHKAHVERMTDLLGPEAAREYSLGILSSELSLGSVLSPDEDEDDAE